MKRYIIILFAIAMFACTFLLTSCLGDGLSTDTESKQEETGDSIDPETTESENNGTSVEETSETTKATENTAETSAESTSESTSTETTGTLAGQIIIPTTPLDAEINITEEQANAMKQVTIGSKNLNEYIIITDTATNPAGILLKNRMIAGLDISSVIHIAETNMNSSSYVGKQYIRIITLPANGIVDNLKSNEVRYVEENGNIKVIVGSRFISETDAVATLIKDIFAMQNLTSLNIVKALEMNPAISAVEKASEDKKREILNSQNNYSSADVTGSGKCYYVSYSEGNDSNTGRSPTAAWKTISKVNDANIAEGSVVLFKRGDEWRLDTYKYANNAAFLLLKKGVIYSSYGEGDKPIINGSPVDAAKSGTWTLTATPNVWVYDREYKGMPNAANDDVGSIIFNGGEAYGYKIIGNRGSTPFDGVTQLDSKYEFCYNTDDNKVYLYCEEGNPSQVYSSIEMGVRLNLVRISGVRNVVFDNFTVKYGAAHGIAAATSTNFKITNCEIGWIGGGMLSTTARYGNGIELNRDCKDVIVDSNYVYQTYDCAMTNQFDTRGTPTSTTSCYHENIEYTNNVMEYCFWGIEYYVYQAKVANVSRYMKNITIKGNYILNTGYGWGYWRPAGGQPGAACIKAWGVTDAAIVDGSMTVESNVLALSRGDIICSDVAKAADVSLYKDNLMIQYSGNRGVWIGAGVSSEGGNVAVTSRPVWSESTLINHTYLKDKGNRFYTVY